METIKRLSKSQFTRGMQCEKSLWLYHNGKEHRSKPSESEQAVMDQGTRVGELARDKFPGGVLIEEGFQKAALESTQKAIDSGANILYEAAFFEENILIRADIMYKNEDGSWDLVEVKGSTNLKDYHIDDCTVQVNVLQAHGLKIRKAYLMLINSGYVRKGELDLDQLFKLEDVTDKVKHRSLFVSERSKDFYAIIHQDKCPNISIGERCGKPNPCDFKDYCWKDVPKDSVWSIGGIRKNKAEKLYESGIKRIADIPPEIKFTGKQAQQIQCMKLGKPIIDSGSIRTFLDTLVYPIYSLDFETIAPAIPPYDGLRPFQNLTFQASVHIMETPDSEIVHKEFLADPRKDPRKDISSFLVDSIGPKGSIIVFNASFEKSCLSALSRDVKELEPKLLNFISRLWDLATPFKKWYMHPDFNGSWSLKAIVPVLTPKLDYGDLEISGGADASNLYQDAMEGRLSEQEEKVMRENLKKYCGRDTLAPIKIIHHLDQVSGKSVPV